MNMQGSGMATGMSAHHEDETLSPKRKVAPTREGLSPGGRPLNYQGSQGWADRIISRTLCAAAVGAVAGLAVGAGRRQNPLRWSASVGANCAVATSCFCGSQELVRELRAADPDDLVNCLLGGLASGSVLGRLHGGPAKALPGALLFAFVGTGLQFGAVQLMQYRLQRLLATLPHEGTVDNCDSNMEARPLDSVHKASAGSSWEWPEWLPIRKLDEEAAKKRALEQELQRRKTIEGLRTGNLSVDDL